MLIYKHIPTGTKLSQETVEKIRRNGETICFCVPDYPLKFNVDYRTYRYKYEDIIFGKDFEIYNIEIDFTQEELRNLRNLCYYTQNTYDTKENEYTKLIDKLEKIYELKCMGEYKII